ncbi:uncharacterized protein TNCV_2562171 [Trichonephila clavipes]|uniref:Mos1 transposase HTH domain-containing protein n=1 Tax=Trichonephila clavipes TaxID=2585209 RepID=A0A8X6R2H7_TRICX|nr:uncharacterized protein TNCV_2562171 [Trichonephila clavipes]
MAASSSSFIPTSLAHADNLGEGHPREAPLHSSDSEKAINIKRTSANGEKTADIKFYSKLSKSASETYQLMREVYGDCCLSRSNVFVWRKRFLDRRDAVEEDQSSERPISSRAPEIIEKKYEIS